MKRFKVVIIMVMVMVMLFFGCSGARKQLDVGDNIPNPNTGKILEGARLIRQSRFLEYNGGTDISSSVQNAINSGVTVIKFPSGDYEISSQITVNHPLTIIGNSYNDTVITCKTTVSAFIIRTNLFEVRNLRFQKSSYPAQGGAFFFNGDRIYEPGIETKMGTIKQCLFSNFYDAPIIGRNMSGANISDNYFYLCNAGIVLSEKTLGARVTNNIAYGRGYIGQNTGVFLDIHAVRRDNLQRITDFDNYNTGHYFDRIYAPEGNFIIGNEITGFLYGVVLDGAFTTISSNNDVDSNYAACYLVRGSSNTHITNGWVGVLDKGIPIDGGIYVYRSDKLIISDLSILGPSGIEVEKSEQIKVSGSSFMSGINFRSDGDTDSIILSDNMWYGIAPAIGKDSSRIIVSGNIFHFPETSASFPPSVITNGNAWVN